MHSSWQLFISFFKIGATSFGGGPPAIPMLRKELISEHGFSEQEFSEGLALGNSLPGPIITNMAVYAGMKAGGIGAAALAVIGALLPTTVIMALAATVFLSYHDLPIVKAALKGIRPTVIALLVFTIYKLFPSSMANVQQGAIGVVFLALIVFFDLHPAFAILLSGVVGILLLK